MYTPGIGSSASSSAKMETAFGDTEVVEAKRTHLATMVWLHGLGDNSTSWIGYLHLMDANTKFICPTAPFRRTKLLEGDYSTSFRLGIGGFSMGAAVSLYSATCFINGVFANGKQYPIKLNEIVSLSGWIPCSRFVHKNTIGIHEVERRAASLRILLCHDREDMIVPFEHSQEVARRLIGFGADVTICNYTEHGHHPDFSEKGPGYVKRWLME
ncbi:uncharacterized protein [Solanum tuberosum]|uniref:uncharacterized protein isoform X2 n=1 Tax=Solanum tuberosum TaxID=4113 RepID=UPI0003D28907|nr:PREDICTED: uncharacterized protein LOC102581986 isoform X2 [Solanum tuberosum]